jgi:hypothetical protein
VLGGTATEHVPALADALIDRARAR